MSETDIQRQYAAVAQDRVGALERRVAELEAAVRYLMRADGERSSSATARKAE